MMMTTTDTSSSSSSSSCASFSSFDDAVTVKNTVKFLCSYGGRILPRYPDGKLRYVGGDTRVLAVDKSISFSELMVKMEELCGWGVPVALRCQLPMEDLDDALVSITSDEDLANLIEEYDVAAGRDRLQHLKIRAFLHPLQPKVTQKPPPAPQAPTCAYRMPTPPQRIFSGVPATEGRRARCVGQRSPRPHPHLVHHGNYWQ